MTQGRLLFTLIAAILGSSLAFADTPAFACSCVGPRPPAQMLQESDAVFSGFVMAASNADATFNVENSWKGVSEEVVTVLSGPGNCAYGFETGERYLVYAHGPDTLVTNICTGTKPISEAHNDLAALGTGTIIQTPEEASSISIMTPVSPYSPAFAIIGIVAIVGGAAVGIIYYLKKKKLR